jgi:hypothetical protein
MPALLDWQVGVEDFFLEIILATCEGGALAGENENPPPPHYRPVIHENQISITRGGRDARVT